MSQFNERAALRTDSNINALQVTRACDVVIEGNLRPSAMLWIDTCTYASSTRARVCDVDQQIWIAVQVYITNAHDMCGEVRWGDKRSSEIGDRECGWGRGSDVWHRPIVISLTEWLQGATVLRYIARTHGQLLIVRHDQLRAIGCRTVREENVRGAIAVCRTLAFERGGSSATYQSQRMTGCRDWQCPWWCARVWIVRGRWSTHRSSLHHHRPVNQRLRLDFWRKYN